MANISNLSSFLTDVADAIREKKGTQDQIPAENFDTEIKSIETGTKINNQDKDITKNGTYTADEGYTGLGTVVVNVPQTGDVPIKLFKTKEEMNNSTGNKEGDLAVVYREEIQPVTEESEFDSCTFPNTVVLKEAFTGNVHGRFRAVDSKNGRFDGNVDMSSSRFRFDGWGESSQVRVQYTSQDGITYTRTDGGEELQEFGTMIKYEPMEPWNDVIGNFMKIGGKAFDGLFSVQSSALANLYNTLVTITSTSALAEYETQSWMDFINLYTEYPITHIPGSGNNYWIRYMLVCRDKTTKRIELYVSYLDGFSLYYLSNGEVHLRNKATASNASSFPNTIAAVKYNTDGTYTYTNYNPVYNTYVTVATDFNNKEIMGQLWSSTVAPWVKDGLVNTSIQNINVIKEDGSSSYSTDFKNIPTLMYLPAPTQLDTTPDYVYEKIFYGENGVENGTLTTSVSNSFTDVNAEVYNKIQNQYENMQPRVLTDQNKTINKNIYFIPVKRDGTPLLNTSKVTNMQNMFDGCKNLITIPLLDTSNVTDMEYMFSGCSNLTTIPELNTSNATKMYYMFTSCENLTTIPLLDTSSVTNMGGMFAGCENLTTIPELNTSNATDIYAMFSGCKSLTTIPELNTSSVTDMSSMFSGCKSLTSIPLLDTSNVTDTHNMFSGCSNLTTIPLLNTNNVTDMNYMFSGCTNLTTIPELNTSSVINMDHMFSSCQNLINIPLLDTSSVTDMDGMFSGCTNLTTIPELNTSKATSMAWMFSGCKNLTTIPLLDTSNVTYMGSMFTDCPNLTDDSLNIIIQMCTNAVIKRTSNKTLKYIGLTSEQANKCKTLSNYSAFIAAGWTTGY